MKITSEIITSRANPKIMFAASLLDKKGRKQSGMFVAEGVKLLVEAIDSSADIFCIFALENMRDTVIGITEKYSEKCNDRYAEVPVRFVSETCFAKISTEKAPQGIVTVIKSLDNVKKYNIINNIDFVLPCDDKTIMLYSMRDPGNLGSVIRSAVAFGADKIIVSSDSADVYNPKTVRAAMGNIFRVGIVIVDDFVDCIRRLRDAGRRVFAAELSDDAKSLVETDISKKDVVVIGNEGHGIDAEVSSACDGSVYIPISEKTESLNASVAAAIFMWEQK